MDAKNIQLLRDTIWRRPHHWCTELTVDLFCPSMHSLTRGARGEQTHPAATAIGQIIGKQNLRAGRRPLAVVRPVY
jgi:hypothetical protein